MRDNYPLINNQYKLLCKLINRSSRKHFSLEIKILHSPSSNLSNSILYILSITYIYYYFRSIFDCYCQR